MCKSRCHCTERMLHRTTPIGQEPDWMLCRVLKNTSQNTQKKKKVNNNEMILTKYQIKLIERLHKKAIMAENKARSASAELCSAIIEATGVNGYVDYLPGDGHGFTPESNNDTHIHIDFLIESAQNGIDINEDFILKNLSI